MLIRIDEAKLAPLHAQIAGQVRGAIASGDVREGERLPPVRVLAETLGVNMHTVLRAYRDLEAEELLEIRQGRGATVSTGSRRRASQLRAVVNRAVADAAKRGLTPAQMALLVQGEL